MRSAALGFIVLTFLGTSSSWTSTGENLENAYFGFSVASAGDVNGDGYDDVIVGAPAAFNVVTDPDVISIVPRRGRAYVFHGSAAGLSPTFDWMTEGDGNVEANYGWSVASAGDVNGDGYADVVVGAPEYVSATASGPFAGSMTGKAYVFHGSAAGLSTVPQWTSLGDDRSMSSFGASVASAGDVNGDGYADLIVGAPAYDPPGDTVGKVYLYLGSAAGLAAAASWTAQGDAATQASFGNSVASAGDVNGDGFSDVIVGAEFFDAPSFNTGKAYVYLGSARGPEAAPAWTALAPGTPSNARYGISVSSAGDVNGDGFDDVAVGASFENINDLGRVFVYHGSGAGPSPAPDWSTFGESQPHAAFGHSVAGAGDADGDGFDDLLVGAPHFPFYGAPVGKAYLYRGSASGLSASETWSSAGDAMPFASFGWSVAGAGDVNGDRRADAVVGAPLFSEPEHVNGKAYAFHGEAEAPGSVVSGASASAGGESSSCGLLGAEILLILPLTAFRRVRRWAILRA